MTLPGLLMVGHGFQSWVHELDVRLDLVVPCGGGELLVELAGDTNDDELFKDGGVVFFEIRVDRLGLKLTI
jgi:hypothetical protein